MMADGHKALDTPETIHSLADVHDLSWPTESFVFNLIYVQMACILCRIEHTHEYV